MFSLDYFNFRIVTLSSIYLICYIEQYTTVYRTHTVVLRTKLFGMRKKTNCVCYINKVGKIQNLLLKFELYPTPSDTPRSIKTYNFELKYTL